MSQQEKLLKPQAKHNLDTLAIQRIQEAKAELLRQTGAEITATVRKLNQQAYTDKVIETSKDN